MPIYEFKCLKCEEFFEIIVMGSNNADTACPKCRSDEFERVVSKTNYAMKNSGPKGVHAQERECSGGSCKTYTIPGETR